VTNKRSFSLHIQQGSNLCCFIPNKQANFLFIANKQTIFVASYPTSKQLFSSYPTSKQLFSSYPTSKRSFLLYTQQASKLSLFIPIKQVVLLSSKFIPKKASGIFVPYSQTIFCLKQKVFSSSQTNIRELFFYNAKKLANILIHTQQARDLSCHVQSERAMFPPS